MDRTLFISDNTKYISRDIGRIKISLRTGEDVFIPLEDVKYLVIEDTRVSISVSCISMLLENNICVIIPDGNKMPCGMILPFNGNHLVSKYTKMQVNISEVLKNDLWNSIIDSKISNQQNTLIKTGKTLEILNRLLTNNDIQYKEGLAAKYYFKELFGGDFKRKDDGNMINPSLNYGYSILRSKISRAICGVGLSPTFGLFHDNNLNAFCLSDDLIEPFRPFVDLLVYDNLQIINNSDVLSLDIKKKLVMIGNTECSIGILTSTIDEAVKVLAESYRNCLEKQSNVIKLPSL